MLNMEYVQNILW